MSRFKKKNKWNRSKTNEKKKDQTRSKTNEKKDESEIQQMKPICKKTRAEDMGKFSRGNFRCAIL